jgi:tRNA (guanine-N7-)-methyltransferase
MRTRNKRWARPFLEAQEAWIKNPGHSLSSYFKDPRPHHLEIGIGKGQFLVEQADRHPEWAWIGVEKQPSVLAIAAKKITTHEPPLQAFLLNGDIMEFAGEFPDQSIDSIYLNFSDPWPKARHAKRRLTSHEFLSLYHRILRPGGRIIMKTDNPILYAYTLEVVAGDPRFTLVSSDADYQLAADDVATEYELHFRSLGQPIHRIMMQRSAL